jgi:multidrug resistance efflux pump
MMEYINANAAAIQALSTVVLVLITVFYAWQTKRSVKETENARKDIKVAGFLELECLVQLRRWR